MAYRRSLTSRVSLLRDRFHPFFSYIAHSDNDRKHQQHLVADKCRPADDNFLRRGYHNGNLNNGSAGFGSIFQERRSLLSFGSFASIGSLFHRYTSSSSGGRDGVNSLGGSTFGEGSDKFEYVKYVAEVLSDETMEVFVTSTTPVVSEVSVSDVESFLPVAALQYLIDGFHNLFPMGVPLLNHPDWWLAIVLSTLFIQTTMVHLLIEQLKSTSKLIIKTLSFSVLTPSATDTDENVSEAICAGTGMDFYDLITVVTGKQTEISIQVQFGRVRKRLLTPFHICWIIHKLLFFYRIILSFYKGFWFNQNSLLWISDLSMTHHDNSSLKRNSMEFMDNYKFFVPLFNLPSQIVKIQPEEYN
ncbi:hypothetical protein MKX01_005716 [Papaver californicum]|nr:hypothetical protein MKX01_005716 [Papaver californicum]